MRAGDVLPRRGLFADTSFFYATLDRRDRDHRQARALAEAIQERQIPLLTTWEIVVEIVTLLRYRLSYQGAITFIDRVLPALNMVDVGQEDRAQALRRFRQLGEDKTLSLCDAISYHLLRGRLEGMACLTFDEDFGRLGVTVIRELDGSEQGAD